MCVKMFVHHELYVNTGWQQWTNKSQQRTDTTRGNRRGVKKDIMEPESMKVTCSLGRSCPALFPPFLSLIFSHSELHLRRGVSKAKLHIVRRLLRPHQLFRG